MLRWRPRRHMDRRGVELAGLIALVGLLDVTAGTGLTYVAPGAARVA